MVMFIFRGLFAFGWRRGSKQERNACSLFIALHSCSMSGMGSVLPSPPFLLDLVAAVRERTVFRVEVLN